MKAAVRPKRAQPLMPSSSSSSQRPLSWCRTIISTAVLFLMMFVLAPVVVVRGDEDDADGDNMIEENDDGNSTETIFPSLAASNETEEEHDNNATTTGMPTVDLTTTARPSLAPSSSFAPSGIPTQSPGPTQTNAPTTTQLPTGKPTTTLQPETMAPPPSQMPTLTNEPTGEPSAPPILQQPANQPCNKQECTKYPSIMRLQQAINAAVGENAAARFCICPEAYKGILGECPFEKDEPALVIGDGQEIAIECIVPKEQDGAQCLFGCPNVMIHVMAGGVLEFLGNGAAVFTNGQIYSRVVVEKGSYARFERTTFDDTKAEDELPPPSDMTNSSERLLLEQMITSEANFVGAAIECHGEVELDDVTFSQCRALEDGGAIWGSGESNITIFQSRFLENAAINGRGGAIYATAGDLYLEKVTFDGNTAGGDEETNNLGGDAVVMGCGNQGIGDDDLSLPCEGDDEEGDESPIDDETTSKAAAAFAPSTLSWCFFLVGAPHQLLMMMMML